MKSRLTALGLVLGALHLLAGFALAAPQANSVTVNPSPLVAGDPFTVLVEASPDTTEGIVLVDFRPTLPKILRLGLVNDNGNWIAGGAIPNDLGLQDPFPVSLRVILFNASRERGGTTTTAELLPVPPPGQVSVAIESPPNGLVTQNPGANVAGRAEDAESVTVNGIAATLSGETFQANNIPLVEGTNTIVATALGANGQVATDSIQIRRDTAPPLVVFETPRDGDRLVSDTIPVAGTVNDIIPGATVNADDVTVTVNGIAAAVNNRTFFLDALPLALGENVLTAVATDRAGNSRARSITVTREPALAGLRIVIDNGNAQSGPINSLLADPLAISVKGADGTPIANRPVSFNVSRGDGLLDDPVNNRRTVTKLTDAQGKAQVGFSLGSRTGQGFHRVKVTTPGSLTFAEFCATAVPSPPSNIAVVMPPPKQGVVGRPLSEPLSAIVTDTGGNPAPGVPVIFQVQSGGGNFGGAPSISVPSNLDGIARAPWTLGPEPGLENNEATATFAANPGLPATFLVSGVVPGLLSETTVSGVVQNSIGGPIPDARVVIRGTGLEGFTGSDGRFVIPGVSPGGHHVGILGSSANDPANDIFFPDIEYAIQVFSGVENQLDQIVVLPFLDQASAQLSGGDQEVILRMAEVPGFSIRVFPHSTFVRNPDGNLVQQPVLLSSSQVKFDKVPMAPPQGSTPLIVGTLQPAGVIFDPPAEVCYPNAEGLAPGDVADVFAFHHDIGQFVNIGPGTVTEDGSQVCSDPGFGIVQSGWHCLIRIPGPSGDCANECRATVTWTRTDDEGRRHPGTGGPITLALSDTKLEIKVMFQPGNGTFDSEDWSFPSTLFENPSPSSTGTTAEITLDLKSGASGGGSITSPLYRINLPAEQGGDKTCQAEIALRICDITRDVAGGVVDYKPITGMLEKALPGQKINLRAEVTPPPGTTVTSYEWMLPGKTFKDFTANQTKATLTMLAAGDLDDQTVHYYWVDTGDAREIKCKVTFSDGTTKVIREKIDVKKPTSNLTIVQGSTKLNAAKDRLGLFPDAGQTNGISWTGKVQVPAGFAQGKWHYVQLLVDGLKRTLGDGTKQQGNNFGTRVLDNTYPYEPPPYTAHPGTAGSYATGATSHTESDSPSTPLSPATLRDKETLDRFETWIMFLPPGDESRYVPLRSFTWSWGGKATNGPGGWAISGTSQAKSASAETTTHPTWTANWAPFSWVNSP